MTSRFLVGLLIVLGLLTLSTVAAQQPRRPTDSDFEAFYKQKLQEHGVVGSSLFIIQNNTVVAKHLYGLQDKDKKVPVDEETIYHWGSITKTLTAIAIMQLRDRGLVKLDDPIVKYVPELRGVHNPFGDMGDITLRHLMSHTAGFRASTWPWGGDKEWHPFEPTRWEQLVAMMPYTEIGFAPGSKFSYSNPAYIFLGRVIEIISGDDYEVYIDKNILKPLEMYRTFFDTTPRHLLAHRSHSYWLENGEMTEGRFDFDTGITVSNGGLNAPLPDMVRYINFLMGDPRRQALYEQILARSSLEEMWRPQIGIPPESAPSAFGGENRKDAMGMCFFIEDNFGQHFIGHSGSQNGFLAHFYLRADSRTAYIVAYNTYAIPTETKKDQDARLLDREIKDYLFRNFFR